MLSQIYEIVQDSMEQSENIASLYQIQRRIEVTNKEVLEIFGVSLSPGPAGNYRQFIREGTVLLYIPSIKEKKKRYLFLFSDLCVITKQHSKNNYKFKQTIPLDEDFSIIHDLFPNITNSNYGNSEL